MRFLFLAMMMFFSFNSISQSYLIMENGIVITTDKAGFTYDFGHYAYPQKITLKGGQYFVEDGNILATIDENGLLFRKYEMIPERIKGKGINYFIAEDGTLYMIDRLGYLKISEQMLFKNAVNFGGNYFFVQDDSSDENEIKIFTVTSDGQVLKSGLSGIKLSDIVSMGGTYFMNKKGMIFTVAFDGLISVKTNMRVGIIQKRGGNYFVDSSGMFYTISDKGDLKMPSLPLSMNPLTIQRLGSHYFIDQTGKLFIVNNDGVVMERIMPDHDFLYAKIISL
jgi:hypothetical protein